ncbi:molybdate ABC transporter substrate-binding protein [Sediminibacillus massiliensis]|uniref:molybdate ABC transporter substrate-binding protein n=1 Tax=Sediminibacillus massiliensis TaxID=1926277 RepID=UPI0009886691|nr:molybdate ABC transporter substrate-binding protein [Sediminibacillus massiliensis]
MSVNDFRLGNQNVRKILLALFVLIIVTGCQEKNQLSASQTEEIHISAASSLTSVLDEWKNTYEENHPDIKIIINYGSSGTLVNQLEQGSPGDVLISASESWTSAAVDKGILKEETVFPLLKNRLVVASLESDKEVNSMEDLLGEDFEQIAIGDPESVPVGSYAKQAMETEGVYEQLAPKMVMSKSARQTAVYVESGNVDAGFVFQSDLYAFPALHSLMVVPEKMHTPITYSAAVTAEAEGSEQLDELIAALQSEEADKVFEKYGFEPN